MNVINIKNGVLLAYTRDYSIYEMYTDDAEEYYMCIANYDTSKYETVIDFPEEYFNSLLKEEKVEEIKKTCDKLYNREHPYIYILPRVTTYEVKEAKDNNDNHAYQTLLRRLQKYTYNVFKSITSSNNNIEIDQIIQIIIDSQDDKKFIDWLEINLNGYFTPLYRKYQEEEIKSEEIPIHNETITPVINNKKKTLKLNNKLGFSNITFITLIIGIALIIGISFGYLLLHK